MPKSEKDNKSNEFSIVKKEMCVKIESQKPEDNIDGGTRKDKIEEEEKVAKQNVEIKPSEENSMKNKLNEKIMKIKDFFKL